MSNKPTSIADLGRDYQLDLFHEIILDTKFGESVIEMLEPKHFSVEAFSKLILIIKKYHTKHEVILNFPNLRTEIHMEVSSEDETLRKSLLDTVDLIENKKSSNRNVQDFAMKFCKLQSLKYVVNSISKKLEKGIVDEYDEIEKTLKDALIFKEVEDSVEVFHNIDDVLSALYREPIPTGVSGIDENTGGGLSKGELGLIIAPLGVGKAQPLTAKVLTPSGWTTMGNIEPNSLVISSDGLPTRVLQVFPQMGDRDIYEVEFNDGTKTECDIDHLWSVNTLNMRNGNTHLNGKRIKVKNEKYKTLSLREMLTDGVYKRKQLNFRIPLTKPIEFDYQTIKIDPYVLGCLLGDRYFKRRSIVTTDTEIIDYFKINTNCNIYDRTTNPLNKTIYEISLLKFKDDLNYYYSDNLKSDNKYIYDTYKYNTIAVRLEILKGLMDTDGYASKNGRIQFSSKSEQLANDVLEIVLSLGGFCKLKKKNVHYKKDGLKIDCGASYVLTMSFTDTTLLPFKLKRKLERCVIRSKYGKSKFISKITYKGKEKAKCIVVENPSHEYITDDYIVTHNSTLLTKIANEAYQAGRNVLHIFFEDKQKDIQRKHFTIFSGVPLSDIEKTETRQLIDAQLNKVQQKGKNNHLFVQKLPADGVTLGKIKNIIKKLNAKGTVIDLLVLDYIDCVSMEREAYDTEEWSNEGRIMRKLETLIEELNVAAWTATQGNRSSTVIEVVKVDSMGGSLKKAQIAHFVMSVGKILEQKEKGIATITILKNRLGKDGLIYQNCKFDNDRIIIDTDDVMSENGFEVNKQKKQQKKQQDVYRNFLKSNLEQHDEEPQEFDESNVLPEEFNVVKDTPIENNNVSDITPRPEDDNFYGLVKYIEPGL